MFISITVTDAWKAYMHGVQGPNTKEQNIPVKEFADQLVWELLNSNYPNNLKRKAADEPLHLSPPKVSRMEGLPCEVMRRLPRSNHSLVSTLTPASAVLHTRCIPAVDMTRSTPRRPCHLCVICEALTSSSCKECRHVELHMSTRARG